MTDKPKEVIFSNPNYEVIHNPFGDFTCQYQVINTQTGATEYNTSQLPKALAVAQEFHLFLDRKVYERIADLNPLFNQPLSDMVDPDRDEEEEEEDEVH